MRKISRAVLVGIPLLFAAGETGAITPDTPGRFQGIHNRNMFGLKAPQPVITNTPPPALPKLILEGITTILGNKRALLKAEPPNQQGRNAPGTTNQALTLMLTEGQREANVEVLQIDEKAGSVRVNNSGQVMTLTFEKDGAKPPSTPLPTMPGTTGAIPVSPYPRTAQALSPTGATQRILPSRSVRWTTNTAGGSFPATQVWAPTGYTNGPGIVPAPLPTTVAPAESAEGLTAEEERIVRELHEASQLQPPVVVPPEQGQASGTFRTPPEQGIAPAFVQPPPASPARIRRR